MSVERFFKENPPSDNMLANLSTSPEFLQGHSRIRAFAELLRHKGTEGLKSLYEELEAKGYSFVGPEIILDPEDGYLVNVNRAAVLWGSMFPVIEGILVDGEFYPADLLHRYSSGLPSPWISTMEMSTEKSLSISRYQIVRIMDAIEGDSKTFATFQTGEGLYMLPVEFQNAVLSTGLWDTMREDFFRQYLPRALTLNPGPVTSPIIHEATRRLNIPIPINVGIPA